MTILRQLFRKAWPWLCLALLALTGCASTPRSRIYDNLAYFETLPEATQDNLRAGKVDIGYEKKAVEIALGRPDSIYTRRTADSLQEIWAYWGYTWERRWPGYGPRDRWYPYGYRYPPSALDDQVRVPYERLRVIFTGGKVSAVEEENERKSGGPLPR